MSVSSVGHGAAQTAHQIVKPQAATPPQPPAPVHTTTVKTGGVNKVV